MLSKNSKIQSNLTKKEAKVKDEKQAKVIAIDGPGGAGKSTVARELAKKLGFTYLDTGAMYRALTLKALQEKIDLTKESMLVKLAHETQIEIKPNVNGSLQVFLDGRDVTTLIRTNEVTQNVSYIAKAKGVRRIMVGLQRKFAQSNNIVVEGRDIGTVVFPKAYKKFYLDASLEERIKRRLKDFLSLKQKVNDREVKNDLICRDKADIQRKIAPLKKAEDAIYIDTTKLTIEEVVNKILSIIKNG